MMTREGRHRPIRFPPGVPIIPDDFIEGLDSFRKAMGLSSRGFARLLKVDNRTLRRWRRGTTPDPGHQVALFDLAAGMGLLHILLPSVMGREQRTLSLPVSSSRQE